MIQKIKVLQTEPADASGEVGADGAAAARNAGDVVSRPRPRPRPPNGPAAGGHLQVEKVSPQFPFSLITYLCTRAIMDGWSRMEEVLRNFLPIRQLVRRQRSQVNTSLEIMVEVLSRRLPSRETRTVAAGFLQHPPNPRHFITHTRYVVSTGWKEKKSC